MLGDLIMKLGILTDIHLYPTPEDGRIFAWHNPYPIARAQAQYEAALARCVQENVDVIAILGDVSMAGDAASLNHGMATAAQTAAQAGKPIWVVPGNHDCTESPAALADAVAAQHNPGLTLLNAHGFRPDPTRGLRVAGLSLASDNGGNSARATEPIAQHAWLSDGVVFLVHHPMVSLAERCAGHGLKYAGNLDNFDTVAPAITNRFAPTIIMHGHLHVRDEVAVGNVLQLSFAALIEPPHEIGIVDIEIQSMREVTVRRRNIAIAPTEATQLPVVSAEETCWQLQGGLWRETPLAKAAKG